MITLDKEYMEQEGFNWEKPEDVISYIKAGIGVLEESEEKLKPYLHKGETCEDRKNSWKRCIIKAAACLDWE